MIILENYIYDPVTNQTFVYYSIESASGPAISHVTFDWNLDLSCMEFVEAGTFELADLADLNENGGFPVVGPDPQTEVTSDGIKFEQGFDDGEMKGYYIILDGNYELGTTDVHIKAGPGFETVSVCGPVNTCEGCTLNPAAITINPSCVGNGIAAIFAPGHPDDVDGIVDITIHDELGGSGDYTIEGTVTLEGSTDLVTLENDMEYAIVITDNVSGICWEVTGIVSCPVITIIDDEVETGFGEVVTVDVIDNDILAGIDISNVTIGLPLAQVYGGDATLVESDNGYEISFDPADDVFDAFCGSVEIPYILCVESYNVCIEGVLLITVACPEDMDFSLDPVEQTIDETGCLATLRVQQNNDPFGNYSYNIPGITDGLIGADADGFVSTAIELYAPAGDYELTLRHDATGYKVSKIITVDCTLGEPIEVNVYPNPTMGVVNMDFKNVLVDESKINIEVFDVFGRLVMIKDIEEVDNVQFDLSQFDEGYYIMRINAPNQESIIKRVIVTR